ncbi:MAG: glycosyltransferase [Hyphomicrobiaceae bacterium]
MTLQVSIVICTDNRVRSLENTLRSLRQLDYKNFEVCVVYGPTPDGTRELLENCAYPIKVRACPERNLSQSRNIGIRLAAGDIIAFLDDDAIPEPEWLDQILDAYSDPGVGAAGGFVHDHTGATYQYRFGTTDRLGRAKLDWERPAPEYNFPFSANFPHLLGANSTFRRQALLDVGGFDEEYEYFLDETDVQCRVIDDGWRISQLSCAFVHHKFMPSSIRNERRVLRSWYPVVKNKIYYGLVNGRDYHTVSEVLRECLEFIEQLRVDMEWAIGAGQLESGARDAFAKEIDRAWVDGLQRGLAGQRKLLAVPSNDLDTAPFRPFETLSPPNEKQTFCFLSQEYPPNTVGGVGRYIHQLASGLAQLGHQVHVLTRGANHDSVDLEDDVWVHRKVISAPSTAPDPTTSGHSIPAAIWAHSSTMLSELELIAQRREITCVYAPLWDTEGIAVLRDGRFPLVVSLQTTLKFWLNSNQHRLEEPNFKSDFVEPMLEVEAELLNRSQALHAISQSIADEIEQAYDIRFQDRTKMIPLGLEDFAALPCKMPDEITGDHVRVLFVGRLEARKGIDVFLEALPELLAKHPTMHVDVVGNDTLENADGTTYRKAFEESGVPVSALERVQFHGEVDNEQLRGFYRSCDVFVAPSRFESFGLIFVEAMMFAKPTIGCRAGGMPEIIIDNETGLLAEPGDAASLASCLEKLISDAGVRERLGKAGRRRYEQHFTAQRMTEAVAAFLATMKRPSPAAGSERQPQLSAAGSV